MELVWNCGIPPKTPILFYSIPGRNTLTCIQYTFTPLSAKFQNHSNSDISIPKPWCQLIKYSTLGVIAPPHLNLRSCLSSSAVSSPNDVFWFLVGYWYEGKLSSHWAEIVLFWRALPLGIPPIKCGYKLVSSSTRNHRPGDIVKEARFLDKDNGEGGSIISC